MTITVLPLEPRLDRTSPVWQPSPSSWYDARALHLIDLENLIGGTNATTTQIAYTYRTYRGGVPMTPSDHVVVATSGTVAVKAWWVLPRGIQRRVRNGVDGADLALLDSIDLDAAARSFSRVVIASGDGFFTEVALVLRAAGLPVHLVTGVGTPSHRLLAAATTRSRLRLDLGAVGVAA